MFSTSLLKPIFLPPLTIHDISFIAVPCEYPTVIPNNTELKKYFDNYEVTVYYQCNMGFHLQCPVSRNQSIVASVCNGRYHIGIFMQCLRSYFGSAYICNYVEDKLIIWLIKNKYFLQRVKLLILVNVT